MSSAPSLSDTAKPLPWGLRLVISVVLLFHLVAILAGPMAVPASSELAVNTFLGMRWYIEPLFLNHGYRFFAPDPGPSHMMRYEIELANGKTLRGIYPNLREQQPRLLYHRHFMLTSRLADGAREPLVQLYADSYAKHLIAEHEAQRVRLYHVVHELTPRERVLEGIKLDDERGYLTIDTSLLGTWRGNFGFGDTAKPVELRVEERPELVRRDDEMAMRPAQATLIGNPFGGPAELPLSYEQRGEMARFTDARGREFTGLMLGLDTRTLAFSIISPDSSNPTVMLRREEIPPLIDYQGEPIEPPAPAEDANDGAESVSPPANIPPGGSP